MKRNYNRVINQLENVIKAYDDAIANSEAISITKACEIAGINEAWLYRIIDNADDYKLNEEIIERFEAAKDRVLSLMIQRVREFSETPRKWDSKLNMYISTDSPLKLARSKIGADNEKWLLSKLLPKTMSENKVIANTINDNSLNVTIKDMSLSDLRALAKLRLTDQSESNEHD